MSLVTIVWPILTLLMGIMIGLKIQAPQTTEIRIFNVFPKQKDAGNMEDIFPDKPMTQPDNES